MLFRPVPDGFEAYHVAMDGIVISSHTGRVMKPQPGRNGYPHLHLRRGGKQYLFEVHRIVAAAYLGKPLPGFMTRHANGDRKDSWLGNLSYGTRSENALDSVQHGTHVTARKTECPQKHPYTEENTYIHRSGNRTSRHCKTCDRIKHRRKV